jgi:putative sterol carrier protein
LEVKKQTAGTGPQQANNCKELLRMMPLGFNSSAAGNLQANYQFEVTGDENFTAHLAISDGQCIYHDGPAKKPDLLIKTPADVWLKISRGELNGQKAFMEGKYKVEGDITLLLKLKSLFSR